MEFINKLAWLLYSLLEKQAASQAGPCTVAGAGCYGALRSSSGEAAVPAPPSTKFHVKRTGLWEDG